MLKRIKYVSEFSRELGRDEIDSLVNQAAENNKELDITGILVASGKMFFQIIEGPAKNIDMVYARILKDDRHHKVLLLNSEWGVKNRIFPDWSLKKVDLESGARSRMELLRVILDSIVETRTRLNVLTSTFERAIWEEFLSK